MVLHFYYLIPLAAALANAGALALVSVSQRTNYAAAFSLYLVASAAMNLGSYFLFSAQNAHQAQLAVFCMFLVFPVFHPAVLWLALRLSGRQCRIGLRFLAGSAGGIVILLIYSFLTTENNSLFIAGIEKFRWGYYVFAGPGLQIFDFLTITVLPASGLLLLFPRKSPLTEPLHRIVSILFLVEFFFLLTNILPLYGIDIYPVGNGANAVVSTALCSLLFGERMPDIRMPLLYGVIRGFAILATTIAFVLIVLWFMLEFVPHISSGPVIASGVLSAVVSLTVFRLLFARRIDRGPDSAAQSFQDFADRPLFVLLQNRFGLTYQEATICNDLYNGCTRVEIQRKRAIRHHTLKKHLSNIYRKTLRDTTLTPVLPQEKAQILVNLLHTLAEDTHPPHR